MQDGGRRGDDFLEFTTIVSRSFESVSLITGHRTDPESPVCTRFPLMSCIHLSAEYILPLLPATMSSCSFLANDIYHDPTTSVSEVPYS